MSKTLQVEIISPEGRVYEQAADMIISRATTGELGILPGHAPLLAVLDDNHIRLLTNEGECQLPVRGGILQVKPGSVVTILTSD